MDPEPVSDLAHETWVKKYIANEHEDVGDDAYIFSPVKDEERIIFEVLPDGMTLCSDDDEHLRRLLSPNDSRVYLVEKRLSYASIGEIVPFRFYYLHIIAADVGYIYNTQKVLFVCFPEGAGSTEASAPYTAQYADVAGNACTCYISQPAVISRYYRHANEIIRHSHLR